ncbi:FAD-dependent oxidoreductase [Dyella nitratireducens]|uniref:Kynurenine 3-monooxygenase n=1 Tax=Dyella nitratireducens TaxID=1849580 RepID=A0ABQ1GEV5_9GAMM|nr:NAD(P)/FAD-dependent oxidoreductase [Dyella nitratireducens]GGA42389.1 kynurenine 3-monooxygenase [Dyella nitratireducens]GLQ42008.1 kynurenine 3-monooxygenase [Dyella nitratireducens]
MARQAMTLIGGGPVGALLAQLLAKRGFAVTVFEKRSDPRRIGFKRGRTINLAIAERGLQALRTAGLAERALQKSVMMRGRMVHPLGGEAGLQRYGVDDSEVIWSISRSGLNALLVDAAEEAGATFHFGQTLVSADIDEQCLSLIDREDVQRDYGAGLLIGADGAGSALRAAMDLYQPLGIRVEPLGHGYKELEIPPAADHRRFAIEPHALHIWPRGGYMSIATPNIAGSFNVTLFLPLHGPHPSFDTLRDAATASAFFGRDFPDLAPLMPRFADDYDGHPVGKLATLYLDRWHIDGRAVLVGDAAHAIAPFHGQGMNCGFEDTVVLAELLAGCGRDTAGAFAKFQQIRKPNADAIAAMTLENYVEMRDSVADPRYLAKLELSTRMTQWSPEYFMSRYRMVTFTLLPYAYAYERGRVQNQVLEQLLRDFPRAGDVPQDVAMSALQAALPPLPSLLDSALTTIEGAPVLKPAHARPNFAFEV